MVTMTSTLQCLSPSDCVFWLICMLVYYLEYKLHEGSYVSCSLGHLQLWDSTWHQTVLSRYLIINCIIFPVFFNDSCIPSYTSVISRKLVNRYLETKLDFKFILNLCSNNFWVTKNKTSKDGSLIIIDQSQFIPISINSPK